MEIVMKIRHLISTFMVFTTLGYVSILQWSSKEANCIGIATMNNQKNKIKLTKEFEEKFGSPKSKKPSFLST